MLDQLYSSLNVTFTVDSFPINLIQDHIDHDKSSSTSNTRRTVNAQWLFDAKLQYLSLSHIDVLQKIQHATRVDWNAMIGPHLEMALVDLPFISALLGKE